MVHTLISVSGMVLFALCVAVFWFIFYLLIRFLVDIVRRMIAGQGKKITKIPYVSKKIVLVIVGLSLLFHTVNYVEERIEYMGKDNSNLTAKEYFVLGKVVSIHRKLLTRYLDPDSVLIVPLADLHKKIYDTGIHYIPEDDAERAIWDYRFNLYFYAYKKYLPEKRNRAIQSIYFTGHAVQLMDESYSAIHMLGAGEMSDKSLSRYERHLTLAKLAQYYSKFHLGVYAPKGTRDISYYDNGDFYSNRDWEILEYLENIKLLAKTDQSFKAYFDKHPYAVFSYYEAVNKTSIDLLGKAIDQVKFSCDHPASQAYINNRLAFEEYALKGHSTSFQKLPKMTQHWFKRYMIGFGADYYWYIFRTYCGVDFIGTPTDDVEWLGRDYVYKKKYRLIEEALNNGK